MPNNNEDLLAELSDESKQNLQSIEKELTFLLVKWHIYCQLFKTSKGANTLWEASELIYSIFRESLRDDLVITISRLTDKANNGQNKNSTLCRLHNDLKEILSNRHNNKESQYDSEQFKKFESQLEELETCIKNIKLLRNKIKAHRDLETIIKQSEMDLIKQSEDKKENGVTGDTFDLDINKSIGIMQDILFIFLSIFRIHQIKGVKLDAGNKNVGYFIKNLEEGNKWRKDRIENM